MLHPFDDTIAAISTPTGTGGIGIVRLSGPDALRIAAEVFRPAASDRAVRDQESFTTCYGRVLGDDGQVVDEAILTVMRAPRTYTTQDVVEVNCHGGIVPLRRALELVLHHGARLADPGEFTKRAFYFGRIDLAQAEAVCDIINARTEEARRAAMEQLQGRLSDEVHALREGILDLSTHLEAAIDFGEDDIELISPETQAERLDALRAHIGRLLAEADSGRALREGLRAAIVGRPNVGKSSLMNALLGESRVIVTEIPGTTRDVVEDTVSIGGIPVILADTAGLRDTNDVVENAGVERARAAMDLADLVLLVMDGSQPLQHEDAQLLGDVPPDKTLLVINKQDLPQRLDVPRGAGVSPADSLSPADVAFPPDRIVPLSATRHTGLDALRDHITRMVWHGHTGPSGEALVTNVRHKDALERAQAALSRARSTLADGLTEEYVAEDLREALDALGEIIGTTFAGDRTQSEEIINRIFETFCIGK
jgi:tRNA modification GTPase